MQTLIRALVVLVLSATSLSAEVLISSNANWNYFKGRTEASQPDAAAWRAAGFDDGGWTQGIAYFYYGETLTGTLLSDMNGGYTSLFLRKSFVVTNLADLSALVLSTWCDDGFIAWINGAEVARYNMPAGDVAYTNAASSALEISFNAYVLTNLNSFLLDGTNVLAIHAFNSGLANSSDFVMNAALESVLRDPFSPGLSQVSPEAGPVTSLTQITVTFSEQVTNVFADDLLINGAPATSVLGSGTTYAFFFPQPAYGTVQITWNSLLQIADLAIPPNPFDASAPGTSWQYTLRDLVPPAVAATQPLPDAIVSTLTQVEVTFSEPVSGVDVPDLLIGGVAATNVLVLAPDRYLFLFAQPATGLVSVAWDPGHGIRDLAATPNDFAGGSWSYLLDPDAAREDVIITEFMADNQRTLRDEDGDSPDWIEIHNAGSGPVNLDGWYLTDSRTTLTKWRFPATNIMAGGYLIVFASEKNRRAAGAPLHTNFKLSNDGEYLALVKPDGVTVASAYGRAYPAQILDVSYGLPTVSAPVVLVSTNAPARILVPTETDPAGDWRVAGFDDDDWLIGSNGAGFETGTPGNPGLSNAIATDLEALMFGQNASAYIRVPFTVADPGAFDILTLRMQYDDGFAAYLNVTEAARRNAPASVSTIADSTNDFSGNQGQENWTYGSYNKTADSDHVYQTGDFVAFPRAEGAHSAGNYWTGTIWDWYAGNPPWTTLTATGGHPNGETSSGGLHWAIRRWTSEVQGTLRIRVRLAKTDTAGGNGVTGRIFHNGVEIYSRTIAYNNAAGANETVLIPAVVAGDLIDVALGPEGTDGTGLDGNDSSLLTVLIEHIEDLPVGWNSVAAQAQPNAQAVLFEDVDVSAYLPGVTAGENILAIHGLNLAASDNDFLVTAELVARSRTIQRDQPRYFSVPTPGAPNNYGVDVLGPIISDVTHTPAQPRDEDNLYVMANVSPSFAVVGPVTLRYRAMFSNEVTKPMLDDGLNGDVAAGDGIYAAFIPAAAATPGQMIRWYVTASDTEGHVSRLPAYEDTVNSPQYLGTVVFVLQTNNLPLFHWFAQTPSVADTAAGTKCSLYYLGEFYDNVRFDLHGQSSQGFPKKSYDIDFNPGYNFLYDPNEARVDDINLLTTYPDKAHMRNILAYGTYRDADCPYHFVIPVRVQQNGSFWGDAHLVENGDENYLKRLGLDPRGALYKMYSTFQSAAEAAISLNANAEKKTRKNEGNADLLELLAGCKLTGSAQAAYLYDNINIPQVVNFLAAKIITADVDCCHKNYYFYRDTEGNREWWMTPWDVDLSFGRNWESAFTYWHDDMHPANGLNVGNNNSLPQAIFNTPATLQMYRRRIRTLMDEQVQPPGLSPYLRTLEQQVDAWYAMFAPDAALDLNKWGFWGNGQATATDLQYRQTLAQAVDILKDDFLEPRRTFLYVSSSVTSGGAIPLAQPASAVVNFGTIEYNPASGNQAQEYLQLLNTNNYAVDISGWRISGGIDYTFQGGTVIPSASALYVSPDVTAFRARPSGPRGGQGLFVQGNYQGQLSARGESLVLLDKGGRVVQSNAYPANPSIPQRYLRVTEIMYHPAAPAPPSPFGSEDFEYVELKNISADTSISLAGVRFAEGISFNFSAGTVPSLAPGQSVLVVKTGPAFTSRYGSGPLVAGSYTGSLENNGERLRLVDASGEEILDFEYDNNWYPITDGFGFSLVVTAEQAEPDAWNRKSQWRPGGEIQGSPGQVEPPPPTLAPILVNEVLTHTDNPPPTDSVELYNPTTTNAHLGGWFLSDDFNTPKKYRIPEGTSIAAGGYLVFDESDFNPTPGVPPSFALSGDGDEVWLFSGDTTTNLTGYFHGFAFGAAAGGVSFGRYLTSVGEEHFVAQSDRTLGATNAGPLVGPVVISEIMYHPPDLVMGQNNEADEYVELRNISSLPVDLFDPAFATNTWRLRGGIDLDFPTSLTLPAGGRLLVVGFNPTNAAALAQFLARHEVPADATIVGPYAGNLNNAGERVALLKPDMPGLNEVPYVVVDQVDYTDSAPWPVGADGTGASLQRVDLAAYGNDPINWIAVSPTPGSDWQRGVAPAIVAQPFDRDGVLGLDAAFGVTATGDTPLRYQWHFEGVRLPDATNSALLLSNVQLKQAGHYSVVVFNAGGVTFSSNATLNALVPAYLAQQPQSLAVRAGITISFAVQAFSTSALTYQWRKNGHPLPDATNATLQLADIGPADEAEYDVIVTDAVAAVPSAKARLTILIEPVIVVQPLAQTNVVGSTVTFSVQVTNTATLPIGYRWRKGSALAAHRVLSSRIDFLTLTNIQTSSAARYSVVVTNQAFYTPGIMSQQVQLTVLPLVNTDGDCLPDDYESAHGLNPTDPLDGPLDTDGDGTSNCDEYLAGTDPQDPASFLKVDILADTGQVRVRFNALENKTYTVQYRDSLTDGQWRWWAGVPAASSTSTALRPIELIDSDTPAPGERFYRLVTPGVSRD